ncbi:hypothetical protein Tco_1522681 [Tanacetum coccineum]
MQKPTEVESEKSKVIEDLNSHLTRSQVIQTVTSTPPYLIEKSLCCQAQQSPSRNQKNIERVPRMIIRIKREQGDVETKIQLTTIRSGKRRRPKSAAFGSAQPPPKDDDQSSKKPRKSDASASKQHPALTSTGWQIHTTRDNVLLNTQMHMLPNNIQITDTNSFIVSKKRSSNSSKKLKGIQTLTPAEQEAADIMKALKKSKKMSKRQPRT